MLDDGLSNLSLYALWKKEEEGLVPHYRQNQHGYQGLQ